MIIKKGLKVKVLTGKDKAKEGEVIEIDRKNIEAAVDLSTRGWLYFEDQPDFAAKPIALFEVALKTSSYLLLITWYRDFRSWERSREPDPEATKNFVARQKLTHSTVAIATRLWEG